MKRVPPILIALIAVLLAFPLFADSPTTRPTGAFNFLLEIAGVDAGVVSLKTKTAQTLTCPSGKKATLRLDKAPTKSQRAKLKKATTINISSGSEVVKLSGCNAPIYAKKQRTLTVTFDSCK